MVDVTPTSPTGVVLPKDSAGGRERQKGKRDKRQPHGEPGDAAFMVGIPEGELTPKVQEALTALLAEVDRQREDLDHARAHASYLEDQADAHPYLPVINRRAFLREVSRILSHAKQAGTTNALVYLHIPTAETIRATHGHAAAQGALIQAAVALSAALRASDVIGSLGGSDFGVVLTLADAKSAAGKVPALIAAIENQPFTWGGETVTLGVAAGMHLFGADDTVDAGVEAADRDLIDGGAAWHAPAAPNPPDD